MYGTIARMRVKDGAEAQLQQISRDFEALSIPGFVGEYLFRMDADPKECFLIALFDGKESYRRNAESPEQHQRYEQLRALLEADPEWHDGEVIHHQIPRR
ncbi:MAG: antibiotic biosynthesis monooxygenase family protein [Dehalococcoidia bacterium]